MWTPRALWNHRADGFEHWKLDHVSNCELGPKGLELLESELMKMSI